MIAATTTVSSQPVVPNGSASAGAAGAAPDAAATFPSVPGSGSAVADAW